MTNHTIPKTLLAVSLLLACAGAQAAAIQCRCSAAVTDLTVLRDARVSPPLDGAELRYVTPGKCTAEVSNQGDEISGSFRSKVEIRSLRAKKRSIENDVVWFNYDKNQGFSLTTNYVSADKAAADKVVFEKQAKTLRVEVKENLRYAPSGATVPYTLRKGGKINIALTCPQR